jgi:transducin (beta)-like 1
MLIASCAAGFSHTAYTFAHESSVTRTQVDPNNVAPGTLIALIQKGLQFLELEANLDSQVRMILLPRATSSL